MSRYQWPGGRRKSKDRPLERMRYNALTDGVLLAEAVQQARARRGARPRPGPITARAALSGSANLWVPIGPSVVLLGQASSRPRVAGRVRDLAVSPDGQRAYAASANGGVWFTADAGQTWSPLGNWLATPTPGSVNLPAHSLVCGCLLVIFGAAADASADTVYVGTGELVPFGTGALESMRQGTPGASLGGVGVLRLNKPVPQALADPFQQHWDRELPELTGFGIFRLANQPGTTDVVVAATSVGLFARSAAGAWTRVPVDGTGRNVITDAQWVDIGGGIQRLWVAMQDGENTAVFATSTAAGGPVGAFQRVSLPEVIPDHRLGIAVAPSNPLVAYVLGAGPRMWRLDGLTPRRIHDLPDRLFGGSTENPLGQAHYDLAVAVHPDDADTVAVGGAAVSAAGQWSAALYRFTPGSHPTTPGDFTAGFTGGFATHPERSPSFVGYGVHADVHQIRFVKDSGQIHVWVGCDGGVYRSAHSGNQHTFLARNTGLAVLETGFLASHPQNEAFVMAGTQDNGTLQRIGDTVWLWSDPIGGDGGGVLIHPVKNRYYVGQYTYAAWRSNGTLSPPVLRHRNPDPEAKENGASSFYSGGDARKVGTSAQVRLAVGTNRVWLADDWDPEAGSTSWITIPSGQDPRAGRRGDTTTDTFGTGKGQVIACRWADDDRLFVLIQSSNKRGKDSAVLFYFRAAATGRWQRKAISAHRKKCSDYTDADIPQPTSDHLPPLGAWSDIAPHRTTTGADGSCYVACTGHVRFDGNNVAVESTHMDTLWWYDGAGGWHPTGLRNSPTGTKAPAYAVICDPVRPDIVYVGTALGVWRGDLTVTGGSPSWAWESLSNGLPEAAVQDLSAYRNGPTKILRAAIQARGVWELDLSDFVGPVERTYLRVHNNDARRASPTPLANPTLFGPAQWPWHASPDIRIRPAPLAAGEPIPMPPPTLPPTLPPTTPPPLPLTFSWRAAAPDPYWLWVFQTALHKLDPLVRADGQWNNHFGARLAAFKATLGAPSAANVIDDREWTAAVTAANVFTAPWDDRGAGAGAQPEPAPTEADLVELVQESTLSRHRGLAAGPPEIALVSPRRYKVDVLVHYRDLRPLPGADVRVALFRRELTEIRAAWPNISIDAALKTRIEQLMSGSPPADWALGATWTVADASARTKSLASPIEARLPRAVTFETDFSLIGPTGPDRFVLLLAVVHSTPDPVTAATLTGTTLQELILTSHHVAARVLQVVP